MTVPLGAGVDDMATQWQQPAGFNPTTVAPVGVADDPFFAVEDGTDTSDYDHDGDADSDIDGDGDGGNLLPPTNLINI